MHLSHIDYDDYVQAKKKVGFNIDSNHRCRLQCPACQRQKPSLKWKIKASQDMPFDDWRKLLKFANSSVEKWNHFNFAKMCGQISDPIYHPNFHELMQIRNEEFPLICMEINTNGSGKKMEWWEKSFELSAQGPVEKDKWIFALDGTDNYTNNIYRVNSNFDEVYEVIKKGKAKRLDIWWFFLVFEHNKHQLETAKQMAKDLRIGFREEYTTRAGDPNIKPVSKEDVIFTKVIDIDYDATNRYVDDQYRVKSLEEIREKFANRAKKLFTNNQN
jgi:MoaA/NifB/PqqE/SkfB family radical SAM enzyme